jgi:C4-dicarboxylate-specific signal transduction histidine kinase
MPRLAFFERFRTRLSLLVLLLVVPAFGLVLYGNLSQRRIQKAAIEDGAKGLAELAAANQSDIIKNAQQLLGTLTQFPFLVLTTNRQFCEFNFGNLLKLSPDYVNFGLIESNGLLFASGVTTNAYADFGDRPYFRRVLTSGKPCIGEFQIGRLTGKPSLNFGYPVRDERGELKRVLFSSVGLTKLYEAVAHIHLPQGGTIMVLDRNGSILANVPQSQHCAGLCLSNHPVVRTILAGKQTVFSMPGLDSVPRLHAVHQISDDRSVGMFVCVSIPLSVSLAQANHALVQNCLVLSLVALLVLAVSWFYSRRFFLGPVTSLLNAANALAAGNLEARSGAISGAAELTRLGTAFDEMADKLGTRQAELLKVNAALQAEVAERKRAELSLKETQADLLRASRSAGMAEVASGVLHNVGNVLNSINVATTCLADSLKKSKSSHLARVVALLAEHKTGLGDFLCNDPKGKQVVDYLGRLAEQLTEEQVTALKELRDLQENVQHIKEIVTVQQSCAKTAGTAEPLKLAELVEDALRINAPGLKKANVQIVKEFADVAPVVVAKHKLLQILVNLIRNAIQACESNVRADGRVVIGLAKRNDQIAVIVTDNGIGISPDHLPNIFTHGFTTKKDGHGFGLHSAAVAVNELEGNLRVYSDGVGRGATFTLELRCAPPSS